MTVAKIVEISSESEKSFEDAIERGIKKAGTTIDNIRGAWIKGHEVTVKNGAVAGHRVKLKVTFEIKD